MTYIYIFFYVFRCTMTKTYQEVTGIHKSNDVWIENVYEAQSFQEKIDTADLQEGASVTFPSVNEDGVY